MTSGGDHESTPSAGAPRRAIPVQLRKEGIVHYQVDYWGWSLRELTSLRLSQDDTNLILGGNAARIFHLDVPYTRLFKPPSERVGRRHSGSDGHPHPAHADVHTEQRA